MIYDRSYSGFSLIKEVLMDILMLGAALFLAIISFAFIILCDKV